MGLTGGLSQFGAVPGSGAGLAGMNAGRLAALTGQRPRGLGEREWTPLILDKQGRQVDTTGKVVEVKRDVDTFKV